VPGRTPAEAFRAFIEPLALAVSCAGQAKLTTSRGGRGDLGVLHSLTLNKAQGMKIGGGLHLDSRILYTIIRDDRSTAQPFRISTRTYLHSIAAPAGELIAAHWHPEGSSPFRDPHWHVGSAALAFSGVFSPRAHIPAPRTSLEGVIRLAIEQFEIAPRREDWKRVLDECESNFTSIDRGPEWVEPGGVVETVVP